MKKKKQNRGITLPDFKAVVIQGDQDGRIGGPGVHLSPQIHQEYYYEWKNLHRAEH